MASSYAALVSLVHVLNRVQHPACPASLEKLQIQSLLGKVNFLVDFLEKHSQKTSEDLARKMVVAAFAAEDKIESYIADQVLEKKEKKERKKKKQKIVERSSCDAYALLCQDVEKVTRGMDVIIQEAMEVKENNREEDQQLPISFDSSVPPNETIKIAGFDEELRRLMGQLTTHHSNRRIIPVVGMGGIGKTTLAKNVYNHPHFKHRFDIKAWVTITQDFTLGKIIRPLLRDTGVGTVNHILDDTELGDQLYHSLYGRKYLLILDDIWDTKAWDMINRFCPDNNNGSRILLTTRISDVGRNAGSCSPFDVKLLDDDKSWDLLSKKVFGEEACPPELEECGKEISTSCKGLPLTIVVIGGLLKMSEKTREYWDDVAENISSIISKEDDEHCLKILSLSYQHLPIHLKPCFLYLATYPKGYEIRVSQIIMLWAADGFLKPNVGYNTLEEVALKYLNDLINRNLIIVKKLGSRGEMKRLTVHDFVMDLCMREVQEERFLHVDYGDAEPPETIENPRRLVFRGSEFTGMQPNGFPRSYISFERDSPRYLPWLSLLRVCYVSTTCKVEDLMQLVNLRFLRLSVYDHHVGMFSEISLLSNLETLIVDGIPDGYDILIEIWNLQHIKHLIVSGIVILLDPPSSSSDDDDSVFQNLRTLEMVHIWSDKVLDIIPNIKKLGIHYEHHEDAELLHGFGNLAGCHKLEKLKISSNNCRNLNAIRFPNSLRKLTLSRTDFPWQSCHIGSLPNLEVLKLFCFDFDDCKWNTIEGEYQSLKFLSIEGCYLETWTVEDCCHFPRLERLSLRTMRQLQEIPQVFGESTTLESITLDNCLKSAVESAKQILDEQQSQGNDDLTVDVVQNRRGQPNSNEINAFLRSMETDNFHVRFR